MTTLTDTLKRLAQEREDERTAKRAAYDNVRDNLKETFEEELKNAGAENYDVYDVDVNVQTGEGTASASIKIEGVTVKVELELLMGVAHVIAAQCWEGEYDHEYKRDKYLLCADGLALACNEYIIHLEEHGYSLLK
jgi:hypothetical protein